MQGELLQLFPTPVGKLKGRSPTEQENSIIYDYLKNTYNNVGNKITFSKNILDDKGLAAFKADITLLINQYYDMVYKPVEPINLYITTSWANISNRGDYHHAHIHHNSLLSGTFYIQVEPGDNIVFKRDELDTLSLYTYPKKDEETDYTPFNIGGYTLSVDTNDLVLFPSRLQHFVPPLNRDGTRVSLSFNTFAWGNFGSRENLSQLTLR